MYSIERYGVSAFIVSMIAFIIGFPAGALAGKAAVGLIAAVSIPSAWWLARRLPSSLDGSLGRRRAVALAWAFLATLTVVQTARLSAYMADPSRDWWHTTRHEFWTKHMCMLAYFYAADLNRQGEPNVYAAEHYSGLNPDAVNRATVSNLSTDDPYQYPPQFLLIPRLAIALSDDFFEIRSVWYVLNSLCFLLVAFLFARWYGGSTGLVAGLLIPLLWVSVPSLLNFQYGQFHVTAIALAVGAFLAFETGRRVLGGALLAAAILAKGFPAIVLVPLVLQRSWRDVASTGAWAVGFSVLALLVLGTEPFAAFFQYHIPRLQSGAAFAFEEAWPELKTLLLAGNVSVHSLVRKLGELGVPGMNEMAARVFHGMFALSVVVFALVAARVRSPQRRALVWLALLNLASMTSPAAWGDYVPIGTAWMLTILAGTRRGAGLATPALAALWVMTILVPGVVPIGNFTPAVPSLLLSIGCTVLLVGFNGWFIARSAHATAVARRRGAGRVSGQALAFEEGAGN